MGSRTTTYEPRTTTYENYRSRYRNVFNTALVSSTSDSVSFETRMNMRVRMRISSVIKTSFGSVESSSACGLSRLSLP